MSSPIPVVKGPRSNHPGTMGTNPSSSTGGGSSLGDMLKDSSSSLWVVDHDLEQDAYVSNAISEEYMAAGIVVAAVDKEEFQKLHGIDGELKKSLETDVGVPEEQAEEITLADVPEMDLIQMKKYLDEQYDMFEGDDNIGSFLAQALTVDEDVSKIETLTSAESYNLTAPPAVIEVFHKYKCKSIKTGGPLAIKELAAAYIAKEEIDDSFYIFDIGNVQRLYEAWHTAMPRVTPFYAVKCSPMPAVVDVLAANGCGFDCASAVEIQLVLDAGVSSDRIIFAHPAKRPSDIRFAAEKDVKLTTFDSVIELEKIAKWHPSSDCVMRIRADDPNAGISFGIKYGANPDEYEILLQAAVNLKLNVVGVSFHVGSLARSGGAFYEAIKLARNAFDIAGTLGFKMRLLDLGGGFTGRFNSNGVVQSMVGDIPANINEALDEFFGESQFTELQVIAEPGRYFAEASMHLLCHIHSVRNRTDVCDYLISDGLYGSFNCVVYDGAKPRAWLLPGPSLAPLEDTHLQRSTVFGPTCDSMDCVFKDVMLPQLRVGDWFLFPHFGAYTLAGATNFNGIQSACPTILYVESAASVDEDESIIMWACEMEKPPSAIVAG